MKTFNNFQVYTPDEPLFPEMSGIVYLRDKNNLDWYQAQKEFASDTVKVAWDDKGIVRSFCSDASGLFPVNLSVSEIALKTLPDGFQDNVTSWVYDGKSIAPRTYTGDELQAQAESQRQSLLAEANSTISLWQTELMLGSISDNDKASLIKWMAYIKALKALDFSSVTDEAGYKAISWPDRP